MTSPRPAVRCTLLALLLWAASAGAAIAERGPDQLIARSTQVMGTVVSLTIWGDDEERAARATSRAFEELRRIDRLMTDWTDDSELSRVNAAAGARAVKVSDELYEVLAYGQKVARESGGAFDVTVGAFRGLWKFDQDLDGTIPERAQVAERVRLVGHQGLVLDRKRKTARLRRKGMRVTLGGIAKGYAVDRAVAILHEEGLTDFILQAGGDLYVSGRRGDRRWRVGIRDPRGARDATFAIAEIEDQTFSTSGDYERAIVKDGVRYHHILDPSTGMPVTGTRSVTVMAPSALVADAWSTALFVMGRERGMALVERTADLEAVFVDADNSVHASSGIEIVDDARKLDRNKLFLHKPPTPGP